MTKLLYSALTAAALLSFAQTGIAAPRPDGFDLVSRSLVKRHEVVFEDCGGEDDDKQIKAERAWYEATRLAAATIHGVLKDGTAFADTNAFTHYFEQEDQDKVNTMFGRIQSGSSGDSGNAFQLKFIITCKATDKCGDSLALTDAQPLDDKFTPKIRLCPAFFTSDRTKYFLDRFDYIPNPKRSRSSWCQPGKSVEFFETAGHTFLHEMTHLDQLGKEAGLSEREVAGVDWKSHGTDDIYNIAEGYNRRKLQQASRMLKENWAKYNKDGKKKPELERVENAESYAATATEFWFQKQCELNDISST